MPRIVSIVEGHGEVNALPVLLRRIFTEVAPDLLWDLPKPIRVGASGFLKTAGELERDVSLAVSMAGPKGFVLVLIDSEDELPCRCGPALQKRLREARPDAMIFSTLAYREFESWFIAGIESLAGRRPFPEGLTCPENFEERRDAKGWLTDRMTDTAVYRETVDQASLAARLDLDLARKRSPSFARLWRICEHISAVARKFE